MDSRALIFWEDGFPFVDTAPLELAKVVEALPPMDSVRSAGVDDTRRYLKRDSIDLLINPFGSAFPAEAWPSIRDFLLAGGNLLNIGGSPFSVPVTRSEEEWLWDERTDAYHKEIGIEASIPVSADEVKVFDTTPEEPLLSGLITDFGCEKVYEIQVPLNERVNAGDLSYSGAREAVVRPLCYGLGPGWRRIVAPIVAVDHLRGPAAGSRWVLLNYISNEYLRRETLFRLAGFAALGACDMQVRPSFACYYPEERANLNVHINWFGRRIPEQERLGLDVVIRRGKTVVTDVHLEIVGLKSPHYQLIPLNFPLTPGLYTIDAHLSAGEPVLSEKSGVHSTSGFWCYDVTSVNQTLPLALGKEYFMRRDRPSPLVGVAYPALGAHQDVFADPNPAAWNHDLELISQSGANAVRTCIRGGQRRVMLTLGSPSEEALRAVTAYMLTAAQYDLPVILSPFSELPEAWGGANCYLDPGSLAAQREYIAALSRRLAGFNNLIWDLIDNPGFPGALGRRLCRPNGDEFERASWERTVRSRHRSEAKLIRDWSAAERPSTDLPGEDDFGTAPGSMPMKAMDYKLHSQDVFMSWAHDMRSVIRQNGNKRQLVTIGFAAGTLGDEPNAGFGVKETDFASTRAMDAGFSRALGRPAVICEPPLGVAPEQSVSGEEEYCAWMERSIVRALGQGAAGILGWASIANASGSPVGPVAGLYRADGTIRPLFHLYSRLSAFLKEARPYFVDRQPEDVYVVVPQSAPFVGSRTQLAATDRCGRVLREALRMPVRFVGEYACDSISKSRLIVVPSAGRLNQKSWEALLRCVDAGSVLLVTGPIESDEYGVSVERLAQFGWSAERSALDPTEPAIVFGSTHQLTFAPDVVGGFEKATIGGQSSTLKIERLGAGKIIVAPLPFELAEESAPLEALYSFALRQADVPAPFIVGDVGPAISIHFQAFRQVVCYAVTSEAEHESMFDLVDGLTGRCLQVRIPAGAGAMFVLSRKEARVLAEYGGAVAKDDLLS